MSNYKPGYEEKATVLYNCSNQEIIGIFATRRLAAKYLYSTDAKLERVSHDISVSISRKTRLKNTVFDFPVTARNANKAQIDDLLCGAAYVISDKYPAAVTTRMKGFTDTRTSLYKTSLLTTSK